MMREKSCFIEAMLALELPDKVNVPIKPSLTAGPSSGFKLMPLAERSYDCRLQR